MGCGMKWPAPFRIFCYGVPASRPWVIPEKQVLVRVARIMAPELRWNEEKILAEIDKTVAFFENPVPMSYCIQNGSLNMFKRKKQPSPME